MTAIVFGAKNKNKIKTSVSRKIFVVCNAVFLALFTFLCVAPMIHLLAVSLSTDRYAVAGMVSFWPRGFTTAAYAFMTGQSAFFDALSISLRRVGLGTAINMALVVLVAYPLSKEVEVFRFRTFYAWFFVFTTLFGGGLIPTFMVISRLGLMNTIWALVLPGAVSVWNAILLLNFFRGIPKELEEAARIDGAGHLITMIKIYLPLSLPSLATILLFTVVGHWNAWFDGMIYMTHPANYPLNTYLALLVMEAGMATRNLMTVEDIMLLQYVSDTTVRIAQIFMAALPIMMVYPFLQRFFIKGIVVGSVKG